ncbi:MAG: hypothetical protein LBJ95_00490 [Oscillospiraceae bacterium]|nr:hypothetical protein [Oscillospiraceae bacterium]
MGSGYDSLNGSAAGAEHDTSRGEMDVNPLRIRGRPKHLVCVGDRNSLRLHSERGLSNLCPSHSGLATLLW